MAHNPLVYGQARPVYAHFTAPGVLAYIWARGRYGPGMGPYTAYMGPFAPLPPGYTGQWPRGRMGQGVAGGRPPYLGSFAF